MNDPNAASFGVDNPIKYPQHVIMNHHGKQLLMDAMLEWMGQMV